MTGAAAASPNSDGRCDKRTNIFLGATIRFGGRTAPVRVRDLSRHGAQVEGAVLPGNEVEATLERGSVSADGVVAWRTDGRCGLHFSTPLPVAAWWPGRELPRTQADVDWTVAEIRAEMAAQRGATAPTADPADEPPEHPLAPPTDPALLLPERIAEEFAYVIRMLRSLSGELALEAVVVARHGPKLKLLERSANLIAQLALLQQATDPLGALNRMGDDDLRRRLLRARL